MKHPSLPPHFTRLACRVFLALLLPLSISCVVQAQTTYRWVGKDGQVHYSDQPPAPKDAKELQQKKLKVGNVIETSGPSYDTKKAAKDFPLTLYTSNNCKENCQQARDLLNQRGVPFKEKIIQTTEDATEFKTATGIADLAVPVLQAGKQTEKGFEENAWLRLLDMAGYPKTGSIPNKLTGKPSAPVSATPAK